MLFRARARRERRRWPPTHCASCDRKWLPGSTVGSASLASRDNLGAPRPRDGACDDAQSSLRRSSRVRPSRRCCAAFSADADALIRDHDRALTRGRTCPRHPRRSINPQPCPDLPHHLAWLLPEAPQNERREARLRRRPSPRASKRVMRCGPPAYGSSSGPIRTRPNMTRWWRRSLRPAEPRGLQARPQEVEQAWEEVRRDRWQGDASVRRFGVYEQLALIARDLPTRRHEQRVVK